MFGWVDSPEEKSPVQLWEEEQAKLMENRCDI